MDQALTGTMETRLLLLRALHGPLPGLTPANLEAQRSAM